MRYYIALVSIAISSLYGAQQNLPTTLALCKDAWPIYRINSCNLLTCPTENDISSAGGATVAGSILASVCFGTPLPHAGALFVCCCGYAGLCTFACAKPLAKRKCTLYYCCPTVCQNEPPSMALQEIPTVPALIDA